MGQLSQIFQPPQYWQQFEELTRSIVDLVYDTSSSVIGRPGQSQDGVDVFATTRRVGTVGIQCKRLDERDEDNNVLPGGRITKTLLTREAKGALKFVPTLDTWILATTAKRNANTQKLARELTGQFAGSGVKLSVHVWFWDDYVTWLNALPDLQHWYYDRVIKVRTPAEQDQLILSLIATAFHRPAFEDALHSENFDDFLQALKDTQRALRTGELIDRKSGHVIQKAVGGWRELSNAAWQSELQKVDLYLKDLKALLTDGFRDAAIIQHTHHLQILDPALELRLQDVRQKCISALNPVLQDAGQTPI